MENIADKSDSTAGANGQLPASQYNDHKNVTQKCVERSGQTLNPAILDQFPKSLFINGTGAASVVDSGSDNTITLQPLTGGSGLVPPDDYAQFNGGVLCFNKATPNIGTAVTIAFGTLGAKTLVRKDASLPAIGDVIGECFVKWDNGNDRWVLLRNETDTYKYNISASGAATHNFANNEIEIDLSGGNVSIDQLDPPDFIGQRIHIYGVGSGIGDIAGGTGLYANGVFFTENTGGVFGVGISETEWRLENGVTADYVSSADLVEQDSNGGLKISGNRTLTMTASPTGSLTAAYPISFIDINHRPNGLLNGTVGGRIVNCYSVAKTVAQSIFSFAENLNVAATGSVGFDFVIQGGKY